MGLCLQPNEDLGTQESLLRSPALFRRFLKPWMTRMIERIHAYGCAYSTTTMAPFGL